jgi:predicted amidohydrolase
VVQICLFRRFDYEMSIERLGSGDNLIRNAGFEKSLRGIPKYWYVWSPRSSLGLRAHVSAAFSHSGKRSFWMSGKGNPACFGKLGQLVNNISPRKSYRFKVYFRTRGVRSIHQSIVVQLQWFAEGSKLINMDYVNELRTEGEWKVFEGTSRAPDKAVSLEIELYLRWSEGLVWWSGSELVEVPSPQTRKIKVGTIHYKPKATDTAEKNLDIYTKLLDDAGNEGTDIVCLPECITSAGDDTSENIQKTAEEIAQPIPGPATDRLADKAKKYKMYVVASIYEKEEKLVYNTAVLIGRNGQVLGKYRKTHLPHSEAKDGVSPGNTYPVFETDFGKIGFEICYDIFYPEVTRILALEGVVMILLPIAGCWFHSGGEAWRITARSRALDNGIFLVTSTRDQGSLIVDPDGELLADSLDKVGVFFAEIELVNKAPKPLYIWPWSNTYEYRKMFPKDRRPETYQILTQYK